jgi:hypothetical protein
VENELTVGETRNNKMRVREKLRVKLIISEIQININMLDLRFSQLWI